MKNTYNGCENTNNGEIIGLDRYGWSFKKKRTNNSPLPPGKWDDYLNTYGPLRADLGTMNAFIYAEDTLAFPETEYNLYPA